MFTYLIKAHDKMYPGRPNVYFYGWDSAEETSISTIDDAVWGERQSKALKISAHSQETAKILAEILIQIWADYSSMVVWSVQLISNE